MAHKNPRTYSYVAAILSMLISFEEHCGHEELLNKIINKFNRIPYTSHLLIWMQRVALGIGCAIDFKEPLCKLASREEVRVWNSDWLCGKLVV